jgi:hypothetical protein
MRPLGGSFCLVGSTPTIVMPSSSTSASTRKTSPTLAPAGSNEAMTLPLGWRAPAARHVNVSSRRLVSSTSIRCGMTAKSYFVQARTASRVPCVTARSVLSSW